MNNPSSDRIRLTAAQATVRWLAAQHVVVDGGQVPYFAGVWAIFGHGNVSAMGEALHAAGDALPTWRAHNEQGMAHAAIAYAKQMRRRRAMVCTTSIGPGATNMVTAAALAHVNRLPVLLLPGDVYASRRPDPVLQQVEDFADATVTANDCLRPVSRYFDRITRPEQILDALPRALATMLDPALCGPVTLPFCQDVQAEAFDYPAEFFRERVWHPRRQPADEHELQMMAAALREAERPLLVAGGGVLYSQAEQVLAELATATGLPVAETQAGKGALPWNHPNALGSIGVTGSSAANEAAEAADLVVGIGTRLQDFTTGSRSLFDGARLFQVNVQAFDAHKHDATPVVGDARSVLQALHGALAAGDAQQIAALCQHRGVPALMVRARNVPIAELLHRAACCIEHVDPQGARFSGIHAQRQLPLHRIGEQQVVAQAGDLIDAHDEAEGAAQRHAPSAFLIAEVDGEQVITLGGGHGKAGHEVHRACWSDAAAGAVGDRVVDPVFVAGDRASVAREMHSVGNAPFALRIDGACGHRVEARRQGGRAQGRGDQRC